MAVLSSSSIKILKTIKQHPDMFAQVLFEQYGFQPERLDELLAAGYLEQPSYSGTRRWNKYHITLKGEDALHESLALTSERRSAWLRWAIDALIALAGFLIGYFVRGA